MGLTPPITIVIVSFQCSQTIAETLAAVRSCVDQALAECIVVDNCSTDGTLEILERLAPFAQVILSDANIGFGRACNIALEAVSTEYTLFLNPDATIEPDSLRQLYEFIDERYSVGIVGPSTTCQIDGKLVLQHTGPLPNPRSIIPTLLSSKTNTDTLVRIRPGSAPFKTGWICGAILLTRTSLMKQIGGFDSRFFLYFEETDLCHRVQELGYEIWAVGNATAFHKTAACSGSDQVKINGCIAEHFYRSRFHYFVKHYGWLNSAFCELVEFVWLFARTAVDISQGLGIERIRPRMQARLMSRPKKV